MIVGYGRVSNREQGFTNALEQQKDRLQRYGVNSIIADIDSGRNDDRTGFTELWRLIECGGVRTVVATRCDRLTRSVIMLKQFFQHCTHYGVNVVVLDDAIDTSTAAGKFHLNMLGSLAEMESDRLSERVKFGHDYHRRMRKPYFACFGYIKDGDRLKSDLEPVLCEIEGRKEWSKHQLARYRVDLVLKYGSLQKALKAYNVRFGILRGAWRGKGNMKPRGLISVSASGFGTWLCNPILRGHIAYGRGGKGRVKAESDWELIYNQHEALISEGEWHVLRELLVGNSKKFGGVYSGSSERPFLGLVRCGECGYACRYNSHRLRTDKTVRKYRYICLAHEKEGTCKQCRGVREEVIRERVIEALTARARAIFAVEAGQLPVAEESEELKVLRSQLGGLLAIRPQSAPIQQAIQEIKTQMTRLQVEEAVAHNQAIARKEEIEEAFADPDYWGWLESRLTPAEIRANYRRWVKAVFIRDGVIESIELNL